MLATPELIAAAAQPGRLADLLPRWIRDVPLYRDSHAGPELPVDLDAETALRLIERRPLITKQDIRRGFPENFLGPGADLEEMLAAELIELEHTSGTSEARTPLLLPAGWWAEQEARALHLNPVVARVLESQPAARRVTISSPVCSGEICYTGVPSRAARTLGNTLFLSLSRYPFLWGEADLARMAAEAADWAPVFLDVDPVYGTVFARYCERQGIRLPSLKFILASYEFVSVVHRRILERAFGVPVYNLYGSTETGHLLMETQGGRMRPSLETALLQTRPADSQQVCELIVTTLTNEFMPLVRYRIGDLVEPIETAYGTRYRLHGRRADAFRRADGRRVTTWQVDQCFADLEGVAHYQLLEGQVRWVLRYVPDRTPPAPEQLRKLARRLAELLGAKSGLELESTDLIVPESSGKFRLGYPAAPENS